MQNNAIPRFLRKHLETIHILNDAQDLSIRRIKILTFSSDDDHACVVCLFGPTQYRYMVPTIVLECI